MRAKLTPWSSVVGQSIGLLDDSCQNVAMLSVINTAPVITDETDEEFKARIIATAQSVADAINSASDADRYYALLRDIFMAYPQWRDAQKDSTQAKIVAVLREGRE